MPKFYGQNKKRIDPRYFLEETTNRDDPPWGPPQPEDNIRSLDPAARVRDVATSAMTDQIRSLSDKELQAAWDRLDPFGSNPEKQEKLGRPISNEMSRRFREHFRKMTPEGGWTLPSQDFDLTGDGSVNIEDVATVVDAAKEELTDTQKQADADRMAGRGTPLHPQRASTRQYTKDEEDAIRKSILGSMAKNPPHTPGSGFS
jgi:hypothetical protein